MLLPAALAFLPGITHHPGAILPQQLLIQQDIESSK